MTQEIKLTRGYVALVDDLDFNWVNQYSWSTEIHKNVIYAKTGIKSIRMHVLIMQPKSGLIVNHIDRDGLNNTRDNLEILTRAEHSRLSPKRTGTSKYRGVYLQRRDNKFRAVLWINSKIFSIGTFSTEIEAAQAYNETAERLLGKGNFIMNNLE